MAHLFLVQRLRQTFRTFRCANAISGVVIIGAILLMRQADPDDYLTLSLGFVGIILGMINVVGGFAVTDRMLEMFKKKKK